MSQELTAAQVRQLASIRPDLLIYSLLSWIGYFIPPLFVGWLTRLIFEQLTNEAATGSLWSLVAWLLVTQFSREAVQWIWISFNMRYFGHTEGLLRHNLFRNLLRRPELSQQKSPGAIVAYMRADTENVSDIINEWYRLLGEGIFFVVALSIMVTINPWIALLANLPLAAISLMVHQLGAPLQRRLKAEREATTRVTGFIGEIYGAILAVKVAGAESAVGRHFASLNEVRRQAALRYTLTRSMIDALGNNLVLIGRGLILLLVAYSVESGSLFTVGDFALFIIYLQSMLEFPRRVGRLLAIRRTGAVSGRRLLELTAGSDGGDLFGSGNAAYDLFSPTALHLEGPELGYEPAGPTPIPPLRTVTVTNLSYQYPNSNNGVHNVSFTLQAGQLTVITGAIGSGKTTLLRALLGLLPNVTGQIQWNGANQRLEPPYAAFTPQVPHLFSDTLADNLSLGWPINGDLLEKALDLAELRPDLATFPAGVKTPLGVRGVRLSGGQAQRVATARMLIREAQLLVIDDLSSALDVETEARLWQNLRQLPDKTFLVVSHRRSVLAQADQVLLLQDGELRGTGRYQTFIQNGLLSEDS